MQVLMRVVVSSDESFGSRALNKYVDNLVEVGAKVEVVRVIPGLDCVKTAQAIRLYAFDSKLVKFEPDDIIMTSDVDALPASRLLIDPLKQEYSVWLFQSGYSEQTGYTLPMCFLAANENLW